MGLTHTTALIKILGVTNHLQWTDSTKMEKIKKIIIEYDQSKHRRWKDEVINWVMETDGNFSVTNCYGALQAVTATDRSSVRTTLKRLVDENIIERIGGEDGRFRKLDRSLVPINWQDADPKEFPVKWPLGLHSQVRTYPGTVAVVAGEPNAGKSMFCFNFIKLNMGQGRRINYFTSEMSEVEIRLIIDKFGPLVEWDFHPYARVRNFADVISPDAINIIDYISIQGDDFVYSGQYINDIHDKLKGGIALVCLQKKPEKDLGRGGLGTLERPRLYIALNKKWAKIIKAKSPRTEHSPDGLCMKFDFAKTGEIIERSAWHEPKRNQFVDDWEYYNGNRQDL